jgi:hypothetical protein
LGFALSSGPQVAPIANPAQSIPVDPEVRYAKTSDGVHVAYQVMGDGPIDLVCVAGWVSNLDMIWESPAGAGEVLVSNTVTDLVAGSGLRFEERGEYQLKGVPGRWRLYAVSAS